MGKKPPFFPFVGRTNVGKSSLFNRLVKKKRSIVYDIPGTTRDLIVLPLEEDGKQILLADTPGVDKKDDFELLKGIVSKSKKVLFVLDYNYLVPFDWELAKHLRELSKDVILIVNKVDRPTNFQDPRFFEMGFDDVWFVSAKTGYNLSKLKEYILSLGIEKTEEKYSEIRVALVGRFNAGKSSLLNKLVGYDRVAVDEKPHTTRDSVEVDYLHSSGILFKFIDTGGMVRKPRKIKDPIVRISNRKTMEAIKEADVVLHVVDSEYGFLEPDRRIMREIERQKKPVMVIITKWDLIKDKDVAMKYYSFHRNRYPFKPEMVYVSSKTGKGIKGIYQKVISLYEKNNERIKTSYLNRIVEEIRKENPSMFDRLKIFYISQIGISPPTFFIASSKKREFKKNYLRYLENRMRDKLEFFGVPMIFLFEKDENK